MNISKMNLGKYFICEGVDGSGKSTAVELLRDKLTKAGRNVKIVNILKDDPVALMIRGIVTGVGNTIHPDAEACLYAAAVTNTYRLSVLPLLQQGIDVICDRSHLSTLAYQAATQANLGNYKPLQILTTVYSGQNSIAVDALIMLYTDPKVGLKRVLSRDTTLDRIEQRGEEYLIQTQEAYRNYCETVSSEQSLFQYDNNSTLEDLDLFINTVVDTIIK